MVYHFMLLVILYNFIYTKRKDLEKKYQIFINFRPCFLMNVVEFCFILLVTRLQFVYTYFIMDHDQIL